MAGEILPATASVDTPWRLEADQRTWVFETAGFRNILWGNSFLPEIGWRVVVKFEDAKASNLFQPSTARILAGQLDAVDDAGAHAIAEGMLQQADLVDDFHEQWIAAGRPDEHRPIVPQGTA